MRKSMFFYIAISARDNVFLPTKVTANSFSLTWLCASVDEQTPKRKRIQFELPPNYFFTVFFTTWRGLSILPLAVCMRKKCVETKKPWWEIDFSFIAHFSAYMQRMRMRWMGCASVWAKKRWIPTLFHHIFTSFIEKNLFDGFLLRYVRNQYRAKSRPRVSSVKLQSWIQLFNYSTILRVRVRWDLRRMIQSISYDARFDYTEKNQ